MMGWTLDYIRSLSKKDYSNLIAWNNEKSSKIKIMENKRKRKQW